MKIDWQEIELTDADGETFGYNDCPYGKEWFVRKLQEFGRTRAMLDVFFARVGAEHEDPEDPSTWGPRSLDEVDWNGFPVTADGTLCKLVRISESGLFDTTGSEIEDWDEVKNVVDEVDYVSGLLGWDPYTALYAVSQHGHTLHYMVAEPVYSLTRLAEAIGWPVNKLATYRARKGRDGRPLVPPATFPEGPLWTHHDAAEFIAAHRSRRRLEG